MRRSLTVCCRRLVLRRQHRPLLQSTSSNQFYLKFNQLHRRSLCSSLAVHQQQQVNSTKVPARYLGQPSHGTHPQLLAPGELMPGIPRSEFALRRQRLFEAVRAELADNASYEGKWSISTGRLVVVVHANRLLYSAPDVPVRFRQCSDFLYLTGLQEPSACLVLYNDEAGRVNECLFVQAREPKKELWDGPLPGPEGIVELTGIDEARTRDRLRSFLHDATKLPGPVAVCADLATLAPVEATALKQAHQENSCLMNASPTRFVHQLRWIKSESEQRLVRHTCLAGSAALTQVIRSTRPGMSESVLVGEMELQSRLRGAGQLAYPPVVAAGDRANIIHYMQADQIIEPDDLILMDAGLDYFGYVSDITRTWPAGGTFSPAQRLLYESLLEVHTSLLEVVKSRAASLTVNDLLTRQMELLAAQFYKLGIITPDQLNDIGVINQTLHRYAPHHVSHYLGMDVHDTGSVARNVPLQPGVLITVEPGVYFPASDTRVPEHLRGLGIRIEDDVLITEKGADVLTDTCPRTIDQIEALFK